MHSCRYRACVRRTFIPYPHPIPQELACWPACFCAPSPHPGAASGTSFARALLPPRDAKQAAVVKSVESASFLARAGPGGGGLCRGAAQCVFTVSSSIHTTPTHALALFVSSGSQPSSGRTPNRHGRDANGPDICMLFSLRRVLAATLLVPNLLGSSRDAVTTSMVKASWER